MRFGQIFKFLLIPFFFQFAVPSSTSRHYRRNRLFYEFFIPVLPEHERAHVVEFRVLNSNSPSTTSPLLDDTPLGTRNRRARRSWAVVVKKDGVRIHKDTRRYRPIKDGMYDVFDVTEAVASYLNDNRGNLIIIIKERSRDESDEDNQEKHDSSDQSSCASPGNGLLVLYSRNSHFFHDVYQRFTSGSSPTITENRQRRHSQMNGSQRRRLRPRQREKNRKNKKSPEKDKQLKRNKSKSEKIPCGRYDYTIDFDVIGWGKWIVAPKKFNAYLCSGSCAFNIEVKHNSSNHAMLQSLMRLKQPEVTPMPCCVPTKLRSISMMYFELGEIVVRKHQDVIAEECGCR